jgi:hypothetical protein
MLHLWRNIHTISSGSFELPEDGAPAAPKHIEAKLIFYIHCLLWKYISLLFLSSLLCASIVCWCFFINKKPKHVANKKIQWNLVSRTIRFTNKFSEQKTVSDDERCLGLRTRKLATAASWENRRWSVSCWLTNLVSVYEHFGSRTASRNELSSWTEVPLYMNVFATEDLYFLFT